MDDKHWRQSKAKRPRDGHLGTSILYELSTLPVSIALAISIIINAALLVRSNNKQVEKDGATINDYKKK